MALWTGCPLIDVTSVHVLGKFGKLSIDDSGNGLVHLNAICSRYSITRLVDQISNKICRLVHIHVGF